MEPIHRWGDADARQPLRSSQRRKSTNSLERDVIAIATGFMTLAVIVFVAVWYNNRLDAQAQAEYYYQMQQTP